MSHVAVTFEDLLADFNETAGRWKAFFAEHPAAAEVATDIAGAGTIGGLAWHIYAATTRICERLQSEPVSDRRGFRDAHKDLAAAWELQATSADTLGRILGGASEAWLEEVITLPTRSAGEITTSRRKLCLHAFVHTIRHWAQIGPIVRQNGFAPGWPQDILGSQSIR